MFFTLVQNKFDFQVKSPIIKSVDNFKIVLLRQGGTVRNIKKLAVSVCFCSFAIQLNSASFDFDGSSDADFKIPDKSVAETPDCSYSGVYEFPIELCSPKMRPSDRAETCQIPADILKEMSTKDLIETIINYPFFLSGLLSSSIYPGIQRGFVHLTRQFNGLQELLKRGDAGTELIKRYRSTDLVCFADNPSAGVENDYIFKFYYLEILLAQDKIMAGLNEAQKAELKKEILRKYGIKQTMKECYGGGLDREVMDLLEKAFQDTLKTAETNGSSGFAVHDLYAF